MTFLKVKKKKFPEEAQSRGGWAVLVQYLTHVWEHFDAGLHWGLLQRVEPGTVVDPEHPLQQLDKYWLASLQDTDKD